MTPGQVIYTATTINNPVPSNVIYNKTNPYKQLSKTTFNNYQSNNNASSVFQPRESTMSKGAIREAMKF
jgi:hypothetical protein